MSAQKIELEHKRQPKEKVSEQEFEKNVLELAEKGITAERIGETLRKQGIHPNDYSKRISQIIKEKGSYVVPEMKNIQEKLEKIVKHTEKNRQDKKAIREKDRIFAKLRRTKQYFNN